MERRILRLIAAVVAAVVFLCLYALKPATARLLSDSDGPAAGRKPPYATCMQLALSQPGKGLRNALARMKRSEIRVSARREPA